MAKLLIQVASLIALLGVADAAPARPLNSTASAAVDQSGDVPGYVDANAPYRSQTPTPLTVVPTSFGLDSQISAIYTTAPLSGPGAADTQRSPFPTGATTHGPYSGSPTVTGAVTNSVLGSTIAPLGPNPTATYYNTDGALQQPEPIPYTPAGVRKSIARA